MRKHCSHLNQIREVTPSGDGCRRVSGDGRYLGCTFAFVLAAVTSVAAMTQRTGTRPSIRLPRPAIPLSNPSSLERTGSGVIQMSYLWNRGKEIRRSFR